MHDPYCRLREALRNLFAKLWRHPARTQKALELPCNQRVCQGVVYRICAREYMLQQQQSLTTKGKYDVRLCCYFGGR